MAHALIVGDIGVGKSTLINRVLEELNVSIAGFETKKEERLWDKEKGLPVFIHKAGAERHFTEENLLGWRCCPNKVTFTETFDRYSEMLRNISGCDIIKMDEIGFMEAGSEAFRSAILKCLDGDIPVIAAVKSMEGVPFLEEIRSHSKCVRFDINAENRDELFKEVLDFMRKQLEK